MMTTLATETPPVALPSLDAAQRQALLDDCRSAALALLERNLTPQGILAASRTDAAEARRYTRVFARDAAICVLAMAGSGVPALEAGAIASLDSLAAQQARNGQIPKFVEAEGENADFWYLGCIDASLWWLLAVHHARTHSALPGIKSRWQYEVQRTLDWLLAQEHPRFCLLQQNEASDWADIMPRSGFVLYTNALWYRVKQLYGVARAEQTRAHFDDLFRPFKRELPEDRRTRLMGHYVRRGRRNPNLYLSFVNLSYGGDEGDVFGNILTILCGLAGDSMAQSIVRTLQAAKVADPYPVRVVTRPISADDALWRDYMARHGQNRVHQYHNGGIWPFVGGCWVMALARLGKHDAAREALVRLAWVNSLDDWRFTEWFHGQTLKPMGMAGQSWNAATFLLALQSLDGRSVWRG